jgi:hypothetical protein
MQFESFANIHPLYLTSGHPSNQLSAPVLRVLLSAAILFASAPAHAWSEAGHRIISSIAFRQLTPAEQDRIVTILKQHPRYAQDFQGKMPAGLDTKEQNEFIFQQAGIWPDLARAFKGGDRQYHHSTWHYFNWPHWLTNTDQAAMAGSLTVNLKLDPPSSVNENMNAIQTIRIARRMIADKSTPDAEKAVMLCWLFHCIEDIHQPLHSTAMFSETLFPKGDRGGNSVKTKQKENLHALWDQFLGNKALPRTARNKAIAIMNDAAKSQLGRTAAVNLDEKEWMLESHSLAGNTVYDHEVRGHLRAYADKAEAPELELTERYLKTGGRAAEERAIQAGYRLGAVLKELAGEQ